MGGLLLAVGVLAVCLVYGSLSVFIGQALGFQMNHRTGTVQALDVPCSDPPNCVQSGDRVVRIVGLGDRVLTPPFRYVDEVFARSHGALEVTVVRDGRERTFAIKPRRGDLEEWIQNVSQGLVPLAFWLVGLVATLFLRPRDASWRLLVGWSHLTALWFAAGLASHTFVGFSSHVFHVSIWLWAAVFLHLHLVLPRPWLSRLWRRRLLAGFYMAALGMALADQLGWVASTAYAVPVLAVILLSLGLLVAALFRAKGSEQLRAARVMLFGVAMGCLPVVVLGILPLFFSPWSRVPSFSAQILAGLIAVVAIPLWPLSYLYAVNRPGATTLRWRGNRLLGVYGFAALVVFGYLSGVYLVAVLFGRLQGEPLELEPRFLFVVVALSTLLALVSPLLWRRFQRWVDRRVFGIHYSPSEVVETLAERIPAGLDRERFREILQSEVLPTLMIRESALYAVSDGRLNLAHSKGVDAPAPDDLSLPALREVAGRFLTAGEGSPLLPVWLRLALVIELQDEWVAVWLLGRRDPDDFYSAGDIDLLGKVGNQIAAVLKMQQAIARGHELRQRLVESEKMEALGRLAAGVAHDFNNLLAVIMGATEMVVSSEDQMTSESREMLDEVLGACTRAANLTQQLLAFSRRQTLEVQLLDIDETVFGMQSILKSLLGRGARLRFALSGSGARVRVDLGQFEQVLLNLTVNAADAMPDGGTLTLSTDRVTRVDSRPDVASEASSGDFIRLRVADTGRGIPTESQARIFEPFYTTKRSSGGTGLGLATVDGIVHQSGGWVEVASEVGAGTTFDVFLPLVRGESTRRATPKPLELGEGENPLTPGLKVLLVDDDDSVRKLAWRLLRSWGCDVVPASDAREALEVSRSLPGKLDLLIADVVMPGMRGDELAERLSAERPETSVVLVSGFYPEAGETSKDRGRGFPVVTKPFTSRQLLDGILKALNGDAGVS